MGIHSVNISILIFRDVAMQNNAFVLTMTFSVSISLWSALDFARKNNY